MQTVARVLTRPATKETGEKGKKTHATEDMARRALQPHTPS